MIPDMTQRFPEGLRWVGCNKDCETYYFEDTKKETLKHKGKKSRQAKRVAIRKVMNRHYVEEKDLPF